MCSAPLRRRVIMLGIMALSLSTFAWGQEWQEIAGDLMSPACPGRTLLNCTSNQAEQWRELIRQKLSQGESRAQIIQHFIDIGGEAILAAPPKQGFALTAWLLPLFVIANGSALILVLIHRWARRRATATPGVAVDSAATSAALSPSDPYVHRLRRELAEFND